MLKRAFASLFVLYVVLSKRPDRNLAVDGWPIAFVTQANDPSHTKVCGDTSKIAGRVAATRTVQEDLRSTQ